MRDRRFDTRQAIGETIGLNWTDPQGGRSHTSGELCDLSLSGAQVRIDRPIRLQTSVSLQTREQDLRGSVRYCTRSEASYLVGIEFDAA